MQRREYGEDVTLETRGEANETVDRERRYRQIRHCFAIKPNMTAKECAVLMNKLGYCTTTERNVAAPRITELCQKGFLEPIGKTKCQYTGKTVAVYAVRE